MAIFKKINRGVILFTVLVLAVGGYLAALHFIRQSDKNEIQDTVLDYVAAVQADLPLGDRSPQTALSDAKKNQLKFFADERAAEPTFTQLKELYEAQSELGAMDAISLTVVKINSITFDADTAVVSAQMDVNCTNCPNDVIMQNSSGAHAIMTNFVFEKTDNGWKLFYYNLNLNASDGYNNGYTVSY